MANITVAETTDGITATATMTLPKTDVIAKYIDWLESESDINRDLAQRYSDYFNTDAFLHYSIKANKYQTVVGWLKEYREILKEREGK